MPPKPLRLVAALSALLLLPACTSTGGGPEGGGIRPSEMSNVGQSNLRLAYSYLQSGKYDLALDRAKRGLRADPDSPDLYVALGMIHARIGDPAQAGANYARAARLGGDRGDILNVHAVWLCEQGQRAEANAVFDRAVKDLLNRDRGKALYNAALCAHQSGDRAKAEALLRQSLESSPEDPVALALMARLQFEQGNMMGARAFLQRREAVGEATPELLELGARIEEAAGDAAAAARYRRQMQDQFPDSTPNATEGSRQP